MIHQDSGASTEQKILLYIIFFATLSTQWRLLKTFPGFAFRIIKSSASRVLALKFRNRKPYIQIKNLKIQDQDRMRHTHILGATGSGKSVLIENILFQDLARGFGAIIIDAKGDRAFYEKTKNYMASIGREADLHLLSSTYEAESSIWNPLRLGSTSELQSKFLCSGIYEHSFFKKAAESCYLQAFKEFEGVNPLRLSDLVSKLETLTRQGKDENTKGLYYDIKNLSESEWSGVLGLTHKPGIRNEISLLDITRKNEVLFIDLPTEGKSTQSRRLGALFLQELTLISGLRKRYPSLIGERPFSVFVDEFDAFATEEFVSFLNKGRSSNFLIHLAHQTLADLEKISGTFEKQITGNVNCRFIFRTDLAEDAEKLSRLFGTFVTTKTTLQTDSGGTTGRGTSREVEAFKMHPNKIKELEVGECVVNIKNKKVLELIQVPKPVSNFKKSFGPVVRCPIQIAKGDMGGEVVKESAYHKHLPPKESSV